LACLKKKSKLRLFKNLSGGMAGWIKKSNIPFPRAVQILFRYLKIATSKV